MELIQTVQKQLEKIYGIRLGIHAGDYLIGNRELTELMPESNQSTYPREMFLVTPREEESDAVEIALFLDNALQENLNRNNPAHGLSRENIDDFCALIEGVSHFVYFLHKTALSEPVTQLELELQAEIDKFIVLFLSLHNPDRPRQEILEMLFEDYFLRDNMTPEEVNRYQTAISLARKYCFRLSQLYQVRCKNTNVTELIRELRSFYPLCQEDKIRHINQ